MKKSIIYRFIITVLLFMVAFAGCSSPDETDDGAEELLPLEGILLWKNEFTVSDGISVINNFVSSPVAGSNGTIYAGSYTEGKLFAFDSITGEILWFYETLESSIRSSAVIGDDGTAYFTTYGEPGALYAINADGTLKWRFAADTYHMSGSPALDSSGTIYFGTGSDSYSNTFYAVNPDGTEKWSLPLPSLTRAAPLIGSDGTIYVRIYDGKFTALNPDGTTKWEYTESTGGSGATPIADENGVMYFGSFAGGNSGKLFAVYSTGIEKWNLELGGGIGARPFIGNENMIYLGTYGYNFHAINPDGTEKWKVNLNYYIKGSAVQDPANGNIIVGVCSSYVYALDPETGSTIWQFDADNYIMSDMLLSNQTLYFTTQEGSLYALR